MRLGLEAARSNLVRPPFPFKLTFAVTYNCNSRCKTCGIWKRPFAKPGASGNDDMSLAQIRRLFSRNSGFRWVALTGGEPFLRRDIAGIAKAIKDSCPLEVLTITTNSLSPPAVVREVKRILGLKIPKLILTLSCDGPPEVHDAVRGRAGNFEKICAVYSQLRGLQSPRFRIFFGMTLSAFNPGAFEPLHKELHRRFPEIGYDRIHVNVFHYSGHFYGNSAIEGKWKARVGKEIGEIMGKRKFSPLDPVGFLESRYLAGAQKFLASGKSPLPCAAASSSLFLDPFGNVYPCTIWNRRLGNIRKGERLADIWNSKEFAETARAAKELTCPQCWTPCEAYQSIAGNVAKAARL